MSLNQRSFGASYFEKKYTRPGVLTRERGQKPYLYAYWGRWLSRRLPKGAKVLEVGCGIGWFAASVERRNIVIPTDFSIEALKLARERVTSPLVNCSAECLPFKSKSFHCIVAFDVIEHIACPECFLAEASRVLKPNGLLVFSTPNPGSVGAILKGKASEWSRLGIWYGWADETHVSIRTIDKWRETVSSRGFRVLRDGTDGLWDIPYCRSIPLALQRLAFVGVHWILTFLFGFLPWKHGENYVCIARLTSDS